MHHLLGTPVTPMKTQLSIYLELVKPRITFMVLVTTSLGYFLGSRTLGSASLITFLSLIFGTALSCGGSGVLNQYLERDIDGKMKRTKLRPLPRGAVSPTVALLFGLFLTISGTVFLASCVNLLTGFLALMTAFLYVLIYTPLKRTTWWNTFIGAVPGALPPMGGWAAATGELEVGAWILFLVLFVWQHPHFFAIAWMYREDYSRGGLVMLPVIDPDGRRTFSQIVAYSVLLIPVSLLPLVVGMSGILYTVGATVLGATMLIPGLLLANSGSIKDAKRVLHASILYLPLLFGLIVLDSVFLG
jgi:heme o synthase